MNGFVEISTRLRSKNLMSGCTCRPFIPVCTGSGSGMQNPLANFIAVFSLVRDVRGFQVNPLCRHNITRRDQQIGNICYFFQLYLTTLKKIYNNIYIYIYIYIVMITYNIYIVIRETGQFSSKGIINDFTGNLNRLTVSRRFTEQAV